MAKGVPVSYETFKAEQQLREIELKIKEVYSGTHKDIEGRLTNVEQAVQELRGLLSNNNHIAPAYCTLEEAVRGLSGENYEVSDCSFSWDGYAWGVRGKLKVSEDTGPEVRRGEEHIRQSKRENHCR